MILPGKHLHQNRALLGIGGEILSCLDEQRTVTELWEFVKMKRMAQAISAPLSFDWFVLSLTFLYSIAAIEFKNGYLSLVDAQ